MLKARLRENQRVSKSKWQGRYQVFMANGAAGWHKEITKQGVAGPTSNRKKLVTTKAFKAYSREILSWIAQLKIGNGDIGEYFQKDSLKKRLQL